MKYILSRKEWNDIQLLVNKISMLIDNLYLHTQVNKEPTGDIKYDNFKERILELTEEAQEDLNKLKELTF